MSKKGIALLLSALMVWTLALPAAAQLVNPFSDVSSDHWAYEAIVRLANAGLIEGYPDGTFGGDRSFTRYEMAMVFARILARFEALIDQKIAQTVDARTAELGRQIDETRQALTRLLEERYDELAARIAELERGALGAMTIDEQTGEISLSPEVRAALAALVAEELSRRLEALQGDIDSLARRVLRLEGSTPSRREAELIAERVVADALADTRAEMDSALQAVRGDVAGLIDLLNQKVDTLARNIDRLAAEFQTELQLMGVRVTSLEERSDNVVFTVKNTTHVELPTLDGAGPFHRDPRSYDADGDGDIDTFPAQEVVENRFVIDARLAGAKELSFNAGLIATNDIVNSAQNQYYYLAASGDSNRLGFSAGLSGALNGADASLGRVAFDVPLGGLLSVGLEFGAAGQNYPAEGILGRPLRSNLEDWLVNHLDPKSDYVGAGESRHEASLSLGIAGATATVAGGRVDRSLVGGDANAYVQARVEGLEFATLNTSVLYDNRVNQDDETDQTVRFGVAANLFGVDLEATVHQRTNEQAAAGEQEQRASWLKASRQFNFGVPLLVDARFGLNQGVNATYFRLGVGSEVPVGPLVLTGGLSFENKALGLLGGPGVKSLADIDKVWWTNAPWNVTDDPRMVITVGAVYGLELLGADVEFGYEFQNVTVAGAAAGGANTVRVAFERAIGAEGASLDGEVKLGIGGLEGTTGTVPGERNEQDLTARVNFAYPVFEGGSVTLGGEYVMSQGALANEYTAYSLKGGLSVEF